MNNPQNKKKILVIRNDKIGDFMLAWPSFALLKKQYPEAEITALVPSYTAELARLCEWIDDVLIDEKKNSFLSDVTHLKNIIKKKHFDISISLFSQTRTACALWLAGIKQRVGPATKIAQIFLNLRLRQRRSRSAKPEYEYNLDLIRYYININHDHAVDTPSPPYLRFEQEEISLLRKEISKKHEIPDNIKIIIIHPGTGGSAINLSISQYAELITKLSELNDSYFMITAGPGEESRAASLSESISPVAHHIHTSTTGIVDFCKVINTCDLFISGSTGPLHIAGALNVYTTAFYPERKSATALRWRTLNEEKKQLAFTIPGDRNLDIDAVRDDIAGILSTKEANTTTSKPGNIE